MNPLSVWAFLLSHLRYAAYLTLLVMGLVLYHEHNQRIAEQAVARHEIAVLQTRDKVLADSAKEARTIVIRDTLKLTKIVHEYKAVHDTALLHLTDTVLVKEAFAKADTTIRACRITVSDCTALNHILTLQLGVKNSEITNLRSILPTTSDKMLTASKWALVGGGAVYLALHLGLIK